MVTTRVRDQVGREKDGREEGREDGEGGGRVSQGGRPGEQEEGRGGKEG